MFLHAYSFSRLWKTAQARPKATTAEHSQLEISCIFVLEFGGEERGSGTARAFLLAVAYVFGF